MVIAHWTDIPNTWRAGIGEERCVLLVHTWHLVLNLALGWCWLNISPMEELYFILMRGWRWSIWRQATLIVFLPHQHSYVPCWNFGSLGYVTFSFHVSFWNINAFLELERNYTWDLSPEETWRKPFFKIPYIVRNLTSCNVLSFFSGNSASSWWFSFSCSLYPLSSLLFQFGSNLETDPTYSSWPVH